MKDRKDWFPVFINLRNKKILVAGGGKIASRRIKTLSGFSCKILVVAPDICSDIIELKKTGADICIEERCFCENDIDGAFFVIAATDDAALNEEIRKLAAASGIPVNVVSEKDSCDFFFPAVITDGDVTIGVTAQGKNHRLAGEAAEKIRKIFEDRSK